MLGRASYLRILEEVVGLRCGAARRRCWHQRARGAVQRRAFMKSDGKRRSNETHVVRVATSRGFDGLATVARTRRDQTEPQMYMAAVTMSEKMSGLLSSGRISPTCPKSSSGTSGVLR